MVSGIGIMLKMRQNYGFAVLGVILLVCTPDYKRANSNKILNLNMDLILLQKPVDS